MHWITDDWIRNSFSDAVLTDNVLSCCVMHEVERQICFLVWDTESDYISLNSCELLQTPKREGNTNHSVFSVRKKVKDSRLKNYGR